MKKIKEFFTLELLPAITHIPWSEIPVSTYVSWIMAGILSINTVLMFLGLSPIDYSEDSITSVVVLVLNAVVLIGNTYRNNSTSKEAVLADKVITALKAASKSSEENAIEKINDILIELNDENAVTGHRNDK